MSLENRVVFGEFRVEDWYSLIEPLTFPTQFVNLTIGQLLAMKNFYEATYRHATQVKDISKIFSQDDQNALNQLENNIQTVMDSWNHGNNTGIKFFVRLSTRSPKDSCVQSPNFKKILTQQLDLLGKENEPRAVIRTLNTSLQVTNAKDAMHLLLSSHRVYYDLSRSLLQLDEKLKKSENKELLMPDQRIIVRIFHEIEAPEFEFRVFVVNKKVTAITQYFKSCYLGEQLEKKKDMIQQRIFDLSSQVCEKVKKDHVLDIAVDINSEKLDAFVIELNPFSKQAAACLFHWDDESDQKILTGQSKFEFRYVKLPTSIPETRLKLSEDVRRLLNEINPITEPMEEPKNNKKATSCSIT
jgi:hypothetical protein